MTLARRSAASIWVGLILCAASNAAPAMAAEVGAPAQRTTSTSGIPYLSDSEAGPPDLVAAIRARRAGGKLLNLDRMLLHSPSFAKGWNSLFGAVRGDQLAVSPRLRELAIMAIGALNKADYEWRQHEPVFLSVGGTKEQLGALKDVGAATKDTKLFNDTERAALALTEEMTRNVAVSDATMKRIRSLLPDRQVVELVGVIASYNMVSRFVVATGLHME
jgi:alkylhydroperoxidase family enzyme